VVRPHFDVVVLVVECKVIMHLLGFFGRTAPSAVTVIVFVEVRKQVGHERSVVVHFPRYHHFVMPYVSCVPAMKFPIFPSRVRVQGYRTRYKAQKYDAYSQQR
jgi:hypothetical protein